MDRYKGYNIGRCDDLHQYNHWNVNRDQKNWFFHSLREAKAWINNQLKNR